MRNGLFCILLLTAVISGCSQPKNTRLTIKPVYLGQSLDCLSKPIETLLFYLSDFRSEHALTIKPSNHASDNVVLLGTDCGEFNHWQVDLNGELSGGTLQFTLGVPFSDNHQNPLTASTPLNVSEMFWSWQLGHKFFRLDSSDGFSYHLGSTGCKSASRLRAPKDECINSNRITITIENYDVNKPIILNLDRLLQGVDTAQTCMSEQDSAVCKTLSENLSQHVFYTE